MLITIVFASIKPFVSHTAPSAQVRALCRLLGPSVLGAPRLSGSPLLTPQAPSRSPLLSSSPKHGINPSISLPLPVPPPSHPPTAPTWLFGGPWCHPQSHRDQAGPGGQEGAELSSGSHILLWVPPSQPQEAWPGKAGPGKAAAEDFQGVQRWREGICSSSRH